MQSRAEIEAVLACIRGEPSPESLNTIDWNRLESIAAWHGILPLVYWRLNAACPEAMPPEVLTRFRRTFHEAAARNLLLVSELLKVLGEFRENHIPAMPLKGPVLAFAMYENFALREFEDLDILVPRAQAHAAIELLTSRGYTPALALTGRAQTAFVRTNYEMPFERRSSPCTIEIHWGLQEEKFFSAELNSERWWARTRPVDIAGTMVTAASRDDMLLFLCAHGAKHRWERLKWICDIAALIRSSADLDLAEACREARAMGVERLLLLGLCLANLVMKCPLPEAVANRLGDEPGIRRLATQVYNGIVSGLPAGGFVQTALFHVRLRKRLRDKVRYFSINTFVPTAGEWQAVSLPGSLTALYYPLRPMRLLKDALSRKHRE